MRNATVICDLQFGSTGKGLIAGYLAERDKPDVLVSAWSMNAGHTYIDVDHRKFVHCMIPNGIVSPNASRVLIGPGSQIGIDKLFAEAEQCRDIIEKRHIKIFIHPNACIIQQHHVDEEKASMLGIGSTAKGCGAALIEKVRRQVKGKIIAEAWADNIAFRAETANLPIRVVTRDMYNAVLDLANRVQVEGAQGFSLGINNGFYPYVTSRECTVPQILSDCAVPLYMLHKVVGSARTFPIRVANRFDDKGAMVGYSGPGYDDQEELTFADIGQTQELTTVTGLPRRIFSFSREQIAQAVRMNGVNEVFLNFVNYCKTDEEIDYIRGVIDNLRSPPDRQNRLVRYLGWGPTVKDVQEV